MHGERERENIENVRERSAKIFGIMFLPQYCIFTEKLSIYMFIITLKCQILKTK